MSFADARIRTKLITLLMGTCAAVLIVACVCFVTYDRQSTPVARQQTLTVLGDTISSGVRGAVAFGDPTSTEYLLKTLEAEPMAQYASVYLPDNNKLAAWERTGAAAPEVLEPGSVTSGYVDGMLYILRPISGEAMEGAEAPELGQLLIAFSTADLQARQEKQVMIAVTIMAFSMVGAFLIAVKTQAIISGPVGHLAAAASSVREHRDYTVRVNPGNQDELGELAKGFNAMLADIQARDDELRHHREHLEDLVASRTRDLDRRNESMRLVLDNVEQGLITLSPEGNISSERSAIFDTWFGSPDKDETLSARLGRHSAKVGEWFGMCWESILDGFLPLDLCIDQLPNELAIGERHYTLDYKAIEEDEELAQVLVILSDVTAEIQRRRTEEEQRQIIAVFERIARDRGGFDVFFSDAERLVASLTEPMELALLKRRLHTLKGNSSLMGLHSIARSLHDLENQAEEAIPERESLEAFQTVWSDFAARVRTVLGESSEDTVPLTGAELDVLVQLAARGAPHSEIRSLLESLRDEPLAVPMKRVSERAIALAETLGKPGLVVTLEDNGLRLPSEQLAPIWSELVHLIRNALDHGIEPPEEREASGKPPEGRLTIRAAVMEDGAPTTPYVLGEASIGPVLRLDIVDDGRGINWEKLGGAARERGLPFGTPSEQLATLFSDGVSSASEVSETSGRGVGTAAVLEAVLEAGGQLSLETHPGEGSCFSLWVPLGGSQPMRAAG